MTEFRLLIDGKLVEGAGTLDVINPTTGRTLTAASRADRAQLDQAVAAANTVFPIWSATPLRQRATLLVSPASGPSWAGRGSGSSPRRPSSTWRNKHSPGRLRL